MLNWLKWILRQPTVVITGYWRLSVSPTKLFITNISPQGVTHLFSSQQAGRESRWQKLLNSFKTRKRETSGGQAESFSLKHSHNCANNRVRVGVSNMKGDLDWSTWNTSAGRNLSGYKKTNQDRCTAFSYLDADPDLGFFAVYDGNSPNIDINWYIWSNNFRHGANEQIETNFDLCTFSTKDTEGLGWPTTWRTTCTSSFSPRRSTRRETSQRRYSSHFWPWTQNSKPTATPRNWPEAQVALWQYNNSRILDILL